MSAPIFDAPAGRFAGWRGGGVDGGVLRATGVRYARAERFGAPHLGAGLHDTVDATSWSPACPQVASVVTVRAMGPVYDGLAFDEHCQRLSVALPDDVAEGERLPVMVWLHGGSYTTGAADIAGYDPAGLVREQRVVVVGVTYRLGLFGFLGGPGKPANLGLLDMIEALTWVRRNIAAFGGDPDLVTVFGESAGADAIAHLMIAEGARGLFRRAIMSSPPLGIVAGREEMYAAMGTVAAGLGRDAPVSEVLVQQEGVVAAASAYRRTGLMPFGLEYGADPLPDEGDRTTAWAAAAPDIDVLIGSNADEASVFLPLRLGRVRALSPLLRRALSRALTWFVYDRGIDALAQTLAAGGGQVHRYRFSWSPPGSPYGACHMIDLPFLLGRESTWAQAAVLGDAPTEEIRALGRRMRAVWAGFARDGSVGETPIELDVRRLGPASR